MAPPSQVPRCPLSGPRVQKRGRGKESRDPDGPSSPQALGNILAYLSDAKRKLRQVVWINLRKEVVLECDGHMHSLWPPGPALAPEQLEVRTFARSAAEALRGERRERGGSGGALCSCCMMAELRLSRTVPGLLFPCPHVPILRWPFCLCAVVLTEAVAS